MRATQVKYVPARIAAQYIRAFKISDKHEFFLSQRNAGRVNTTVSAELTPGPGSAPVPALKKRAARSDVAARQNQLSESRAASGLIAKSPGNPRIEDAWSHEPGSPAPLARIGGLQRPQEVDHVLLLLGAQVEEVVHHPIRFAAFAGMQADRLNQVSGPPVVQEEYALTDTPQRCRTEFVWSRGALGNPVRQSRAHMMHEQIREQTCRLVRQGGTGRVLITVRDGCTRHQHRG